MFRTLCFLCLFSLAASSAAAQERRFHWPKRPKKRPPPVVIPPKPGLIINSNLFSLHEPDGGPSLGFEYRVSLHWAVVVEGTALLYTLEPDGADNGRGFRIQPEVRYYFAGKHRTFRGFFSLQATYKEKSYRDSALVGTSIRSSDNERVYFEEKKQILGGAANIGFQKRFGKGDHFMFEMYAGLGLKQKDFYGRPGRIIEEKRLFVPDTDKPGGYPHIAMGARIGYAF
jgi:hypothetical protein